MSATDAWSTPDQSTIERAAMVLVEERGYETDDERVAALAQVLADPAFNLVVSTIWDGRLPTPDAYHRADRAWNKRMAQVNAVRAVLSEWRSYAEEADGDDPFISLYEAVAQAVADQPVPNSGSNPSQAREGR